MLGDESQEWALHRDETFLHALLLGTLSKGSSIMKKFILFAVCAVVATVLVHLIYTFLNLPESYIIQNILPIIVVFSFFYVFNRSGGTPKKKE